MTNRLTLEPIATIAGELDASVTASFEAHVWVDQFTSSIVELPPVGTLVLLVFIGQPGVGPREMCVECSVCNFMPDQSGLVPLTGLADPKIMDTLRKIQDLHAHEEKPD